MNFIKIITNNKDMSIKDMSIVDNKVKVNKNGLCVKINCLISS